MSRDFINPTNLTITHLRQVIDKICTLREEDLSKLDQTVNTYLHKRRQSKFVVPQEDSFQTRIRAQLMGLQQKNEFLLKELDIAVRDFEIEKQEVSKANSVLKHQHEQFSQGNAQSQLIKQLIQELSHYKKITEYLERYDQIKRQSIDKFIYSNNVQEYFQKVQEIVGSDEAGDLCQMGDVGEDQTISDYYMHD